VSACEVSAEFPVMNMFPRRGSPSKRSTGWFPIVASRLKNHCFVTWLEKSPMYSYFLSYKPACLEDVSIVTSIYRRIFPFKPSFIYSGIHYFPVIISKFPDDFPIIIAKKRGFSQLETSMDSFGISQVKQAFGSYAIS
jgi:hypothetical protein